MNKKSSKRRPFARPNGAKTRDGKYSRAMKKIDSEYQDIQSKGPRFGAPINDIKWYRDNEQLLKDVCSLPYNIPIGFPYIREGVLYQNRTDRYAVPGIAVMNIVPTIGNAKDPTDPVNVAFNGMFTFIRSHTSSKFDWDHNSLAIMTLATDSVYYYVRWLTRIYATLPLFHQANKYLPQALLEAQGVDYNDVLANASKFRSEINHRIARINALKIPSELYIFARHEWMFQNYYIEGPSEKDQLYFYNPAAYYTLAFDANDMRYLQCHRTKAGGTGYNGLLTASDLIRKLDAMLDPIFNDQDFNLISGYIEQAYEGKVMHLDYLPDQAVLPLVFSEEVLLQFKNAKPMPVKHATSGSGYFNDFFNITQSPASATDIRLCIKTNTNGLALAVYRRLEDGQAVDVDTNSPANELYDMFAVMDEYSKDIMLTTPHASVTPEENMINTRLIPVIDVAASASTLMYTINAVYFGTEWPISIDVYDRHATGRNQSQAVNLIHWELHRTMVFDQNAINAFNVLSNLLPWLSVFRYLPEMSIVTRIGDPSTDPTNVGPSEMSFFELDNYGLINHENVERIHDSAIMCMLRVPEIASSPLNAR